MHGSRTKPKGSHTHTQQWWKGQISVLLQGTSKRVLKLKSNQFPNASSYHERKANKDYRLEEVQEYLCLEGREWVLHKDGRPHYLRRNDLEPMAKERAILIHSIIIGENINVEEIIAEQFYKFIYKTDLLSSLPFPSIIAALCLDAKVTTLKDDTLNNQELPIAGEALIRTREGRARNPRREAPPPQQPPQVHPQPQVHQQQ
ncbi:hypothetical protein PIB30_067557 [Stylosanthes scabra]|uniref:Uncharacterized protein n=1 Tax=Stylosanthes scabra TaxID=79078 RepID=A0ABU6VLK1_9FABA|nr:hypothetical protein [Stylosanthes scabra]